MEYREGSSDGFRYYSLLSGCDHFTQQPLTGVGFRGLHIANRNWFKLIFLKSGKMRSSSPAVNLYFTCWLQGYPDFDICGFFAVSSEHAAFTKEWLAPIYASIAITWLFEILPENQLEFFITGFFSGTGMVDGRRK